MSLVLVTASGEEHGLVNSVPNSVPFNDFKRFEEKYRDEMRKQRKEDKKMVKAQYINSRGMNERLDKMYCAGDGEPIQKWHLIPGYEYQLPLGLIKEVNNSQGLAQRSEKVNPDGTTRTKDAPPEKLHRLVPVGFN